MFLTAGGMDQCRCQLGDLHLIWFVYRPYKNGHKRGDITAIVLLWLGVSRLSAHVFKIDDLAANCLITSIMAEVGGHYPVCQEP
jgi:prolipoprotein diacylglyceryltransferase